jgi:hypothetical protein
MNSADTDMKLIDGYMKLLGNLSLGNKLELISQLTLSAKTDISDKPTAFFKAFGAWDSAQTAEQVIAGIRDSRMFNRQTEML